jgi:hypothetical protein
MENSSRRSLATVSTHPWDITVSDSLATAPFNFMGCTIDGTITTAGTLSMDANTEALSTYVLAGGGDIIVFGYTEADHGTAYMEDNGVKAGTVVVNDWYQVAGVALAQAQNVALVGNSLQPGVTGTFKINWTASIHADDVAKNYQIALMDAGGGVIPGTLAELAPPSTDPYCLAGSATVALTDASLLGLWIRNIFDGTDVTVKHCSFSAVWIAD